MARKKAAPAPVEIPAPVAPEAAHVPESVEIELLGDRAPVAINGVTVWVEPGKQHVPANVYHILKDANLIK